MRVSPVWASSGISLAWVFMGSALYLGAAPVSLRKTETVWAVGRPIVSHPGICASTGKRNLAFVSVFFFSYHYSLGFWEASGNKLDNGAGACGWFSTEWRKGGNLRDNRCERRRGKWED